jgi:hypothetical protein
MHPLPALLLSATVVAAAPGRPRVLALEDSNLRMTFYPDGKSLLVSLFEGLSQVNLKSGESKDLDVPKSRFTDHRHPVGRRALL